MRSPRSVLIIALFLVSVLLPAVAETPSVRVEFPASSSSDKAVLPTDGVIGQICDPDADEAHKVLSAMLGRGYSFEWTQECIAEEMRAPLVNLFGTWLSEHLPAENVLFSVSHENSDSSVSINVRIGAFCMAFVLKDNVIISMKEL